jgi:hypothetical protein
MRGLVTACSRLKSARRWSSEAAGRCAGNPEFAYAEHKDMGATRVIGPSSDVLDSASAVEDFEKRLHALTKQPLKQALPLLLVELERLSTGDIEAEQRVLLMQRIKKPVLKAAASLPKPTPGSRTAERIAEGGLTLEQRLIRMTIRALRQCLFDYDRAQGSCLVEDDGQRTWLLQQVFRFFGRQLRYAIEWNRPWPQHCWQDLHDLFVYLVVRGSVPLDSAFSVAVFEDEFDAAVEYKRLLLLGLVDGMTRRRVPPEGYYHLLKRWAMDSSLSEPETVLGKTNIIRVPVTQDQPPTLQREKLEQSFRGWVLRPATGCMEHIAHAAR